MSILRRLERLERKVDALNFERLSPFVATSGRAIADSSYKRISRRVPPTESGFWPTSGRWFLKILIRGCFSLPIAGLPFRIYEWSYDEDSNEYQTGRYVDVVTDANGYVQVPYDGETYDGTSLADGDPVAFSFVAIDDTLISRYVNSFGPPNSPVVFDDSLPDEGETVDLTITFTALSGLQCHPFCAFGPARLAVVFNGEIVTSSINSLGTNILSNTGIDVVKLYDRSESPGIQPGFQVGDPLITGDAQATLSITYNTSNGSNLLGRLTFSSGTDDYPMENNPSPTLDGTAAPVNTTTVSVSGTVSCGPTVLSFDFSGTDAENFLQGVDSNIIRVYDIA